MTIKDNFERFNANLNQGLSDEQVLLRKKQKLVNKSKKPINIKKIGLIKYLNNLESFIISSSK